MIRLWLFVAGLGGMASVIAGAAAAHLADDPDTATLLTNGAIYGMIHAAALIAVIALAQGREPRRGAAFLAGLFFSLGIVLFSLAQFAHAAPYVVAVERQDLSVVAYAADEQMDMSCVRRKIDDALSSGVAAADNHYINAPAQLRFDWRCAKKNATPN